MLSACQKPTIPEEVQTEIDQQATTAVTLDLDSICNNLKKNMLEINAQRTTFALEQINRDLHLCLPLISPAQQKDLMNASNQMYKNFLYVDRSAEQQKAFNQYAFDQSPFPTIQQSHVEQLHPRDQYLLTHKGQAFIEVKDFGHGEARYYRNAQYLAKIFAPYFDDAEREFMMALADQNQTPAFDDESIFISPQEIAQRANFWSKYLNHYPKSPYKKDAQFLLNTYSYLLFLGLPNAPISNNFDHLDDIQASSLNEIQLLAQQKNTLAYKAKLFLEFIKMNESQRLKESNDQTQLDPVNQLQHYLGLQSFSHLQKRDCFRDAICY